MKILMIAVILGMASVGHAAEFTPYLGLDIGLHNTQGVNGEAGKNGHSIEGKALGSWEFSDFVLDGGVGYQYQELTSSGVKITTKSVTLLGDARYKLTDSWSVGAGLKFMGGTDNTNSETIGSTTVNTTVLAKVVYQTAIGSEPVRIEAGIGQTVGLDRNMTTALVGVQFALPWGRSPASSPAPQHIRVGGQNRPDESDFKIDLKIAQVRFDTDKFELSPKDAAKLNRLGKFLSENESQWSRIKISGHTDASGDAVYNKALSQDRADSVMKIFIRNGVDETKMSATGYGSHRPVDVKDTPEALAKNRRTEIEFYGVKDRAEFNKRLMEVLK